MNAKKLISNSQYQPIQQLIKNSLQNSPTQLNLSPFIPKGPTCLATNLIKSYFEKGLVKEARILFDEMPERDVVTWTAMITGYIFCNHHSHAWSMFIDMMRKGWCHPNAFTMSGVLKACKGLKSLSCGSLVHGLVVKFGLDGYIYVDNALLDLYGSCCATMDYACMFFRDIHEKNVVSWTTLIAGHTHRGDGYGGIRVFIQMLVDGVELNAFSLSIAVRACASTGSQPTGKHMHAVVIKHGFGSNLPVMNSILDMYCNFGSLSEANQYFHEMGLRDLITYNTLIAGYDRLSSSESFYIFSRMESEGFRPNCFTFTSIMAACSHFASLNCGQQVHGAIFRRGLQGNLALANSLLDMYAKCGNVAESCKVFNEISHKNVVTWTSMIIGYGSHGYGKEAIELFDKMVVSGMRPDRIVFMAVLGACSHAGLLHEGLKYFKMVKEYNIVLNQEIYGCAVDLLGRAGRVKEAYDLIETMPFKPDEFMWGALLGACKAHKLPTLGRLVAKRVLDLRPNLVGTYVMLSNIYAADGKWSEFAKMRNLVSAMSNKKEAGRSWVEVRNEVCSFVVGDKIGAYMECVYDVLKMLYPHMKEAGYVPDLDRLLSDSEDGT